jgi:putative tryptophan/tyrosine transport system substrate-binding protein
MAIHIRRREIITALVGAAAWPLAARAQQPEQMRRIGVLMGWPESDAVKSRRSGRVCRVRVDRGSQYSVRLSVGGARRGGDAPIREGTHRAQARSHSFTNHARRPRCCNTHVPSPSFSGPLKDPIGSGFVASLARPGGNVTGFITIEGSLGGKWLELLKEIAPWITRVAAMFNPATAPYAEIYMSPFKTAAQSFGVEGNAAAVLASRMVG